MESNLKAFLNYYIKNVFNYIDTFKKIIGSYI